MLTIKKLFANFGESKSGLSNININVEKGEMLFITGHSGAGKSTLLNIIAGINYNYQGNVFLYKKNIKEYLKHDSSKYRRHFGLIFQDPMLLTERDVFDNIAFPLEIRNLSQRDINKKVRSALDKVSLLKSQRKNIRALSTGEKQRVSIARAIVTNPDLVLADEPTGSLDSTLSKDIFNLFLELNRGGVTSIIASHDIELMSKYDVKMINLCQGKMIEHTPLITERAYES